MTWSNRFRLWGGLLVVLLITAVLTLVVNQRERQSYSSNATVAASVYQVGSDYGGIVVDQYAETGDEVQQGDRLFTISSLTLQKDLTNGLDPVSTPAYDLDTATGMVTYLAAADGTLADVGARQGSYVAGGDTIATITERASQFVEAQLRLAPKDYARLQIGSRADIELPNRDTVSGKISAISVETTDGIAFTTVELDAPELRDESFAAFAQPGAPVAVTITLEDDGILAGPTDTLLEFLHRVGVR